VQRIYLTTCRQEILGSSNNLPEAIRLAKESAGESFKDVAIWKADEDELVAVVTAGADVHLLQSPAWKPRLAIHVEDGVLDFNALERGPDAAG